MIAIPYSCRETYAEKRRIGKYLFNEETIMTHYNPTALYLRKPINMALEKMFTTPLTVVEAPMGYGKTTAVREFSKASGALVLWKTLDSDSVYAFWAGFVRQIATVDRKCAENLAKMGFPDTSFFLAETINLIENITFPTRTILVIDDYHLLLSAEADRFIEMLIKTEIPNLHVIIISRVVFGDALTELTLKGYCTLIDKRYFELTQPEILEYYQTCGVPLTSLQASELLLYTEGWISALYLCLLSFQQEGRIESQASLHDLLEKAVYQQCSAEVKEFLLTLCIFDHFSLEQADFLWPRGNAQLILKRLMSTNAFITNNPVTQVFQMHNILTAFLRGLFERKPLQDKKVVWQAAGQWFINTNDFLPAMEYFYKAGDYDKLMLALESSKGASVNASLLDTMKLYFDACPPEIIALHPRASLIFAFELFANNEYELYAAQCAEIRESIRNNSLLPEAEIHQLSGELEFLCSFSQFNRLKAMAAYYTIAARLMNRPSDFYDRNGSWSFESPSILYMFHRESGELDHEVSGLAECIPSYYKISGNHGYGVEHVMQAESHYLRGDFDNAEIAAHTALYAAKSQNQLTPLLAALFVHLRVALQRGDAQTITGIIDRMHVEIRQLGIAGYVNTSELCEGFLFATLADNKKIPRWIATGNSNESRLLFPTQAFYNTIYARALLLQGEYAQLLGLAGQFHATAAIFPNLLAQIYTHIYEAAACNRLNRNSDAKKFLYQALELAAPDRLLMPFVENGDFLLPLINDWPKSDLHASFIREVSNLYAKFTKILPALQHTLSDSYRPSAALTPREQEMAELVAAGLSNRRIAETLFVTEATVKKALQSIYTKLHINSRTALTKLMIEENAG
jgi:LuxR family transcriptional regulator, maltose regulon positive regulatory protein